VSPCFSSILRHEGVATLAIALWIVLYQPQGCPLLVNVGQGPAHHFLRLNNELHLATNKLFQPSLIKRSTLGLLANRGYAAENGVDARSHKVAAMERAFSLIHSGAKPTPGYPRYPRPARLRWPSGLARSGRVCCPHSYPCATPAECQRFADLTQAGAGKLRRSGRAARTWRRPELRNPSSPPVRRS